MPTSRLACCVRALALPRAHRPRGRAEIGMSSLSVGFTVHGALLWCTLLEEDTSPPSFLPPPSLLLYFSTLRDVRSVTLRV